MKNLKNFELFTENYNVNKEYLIKSVKDCFQEFLDDNWTFGGSISRTNFDFSFKKISSSDFGYGTNIVIGDVNTDGSIKYYNNRNKAKYLSKSISFESMYQTYGEMWEDILIAIRRLYDKTGRAFEFSFGVSVYGDLRIRIYKKNISSYYGN